MKRQSKGCAEDEAKIHTTCEALTIPPGSPLLGSMPPFSWIGRLLAGLWAFSRRSWIDTGLGLRPRSGASALVLFLFLVFFLVGLILVLLGIDLERVDLWLEAQGSWLDAAATLLFRALCVLVLLVCGFMLVGGLVDRGNPDRPGVGCMIGAAIVAYFAWFGVAG